MNKLLTFQYKDVSQNFASKDIFPKSIYYYKLVTIPGHAHPRKTIKHRADMIGLSLLIP